MPAQEIIPSNIAKTADIDAVADLADQIRVLNDTMLYFMSALLDKAPRLDTNDRMMVNTSESTIPTVSTVTTLTTCGTVTNMTNLNNFAGGNAAQIPFQISNMGAVHLYNQIQVTA